MLLKLDINTFYIDVMNSSPMYTPKNIGTQLM